MEWLVNAARWVQDVLVLQQELLLQLGLAAALGSIIGLEREASGKPAGFRTNLLICLGAALLTALSRSVALEGTTGGFRSDPGRIAAQIVSGMGFLGAGTIMQSRGMVTGLTTAATLWVVAAIGMAVGAGAYVAALAATILVILALMILGRVEDHLLIRRPSERVIEVVFTVAEGELRRLEDLLTARGIHVGAISVERQDGVYRAAFHTRAAGERYPDTVHALLEAPGVNRVSLL